MRLLKVGVVPRTATEGVVLHVVIILAIGGVVVTITITDGRIAAVHMERGLDESDDPSANDVYYNRALNGATRNGVTTPGIPAQIVSRQTADGIDAVSRATYTSNAAQAAARQALAQATAAKNGGGASG